MFWQNLVDLCIKKGTTPTAVMQEVGLAHGNVTRWKNGSTPRDIALKKLADYFEVTPEYLLGVDTEPKKNDEIVAAIHRMREDTDYLKKMLTLGEFSEKECQLVSAYRERPDLQPIIDKLLDLHL